MGNGISQPASHDNLTISVFPRCNRGRAGKNVRVVLMVSLSAICEGYPISGSTQRLPVSEHSRPDSLPASHGTELLVSHWPLSRIFNRNTNRPI